MGTLVGQGRELAHNAEIDLEKFPETYSGRKISRSEAIESGLDEGTIVMYVHREGFIEPDIDLTESEFKAVLAYKKSIS